MEYTKSVHSSKEELTVNTSLCTDVAVVKLFPGIKPEFFDGLKDVYQGVVVESYGSGGIPFQVRNILAKLVELTNHGVSVVITTQCLEEGEDMGIYEVGRMINHDSVVRSKNMNTEAIVPKLMWVLGQTKDPHQVKKMMETSIAEDIN